MKGRLLIGLVLGVLLTVAAEKGAKVFCIFTDTRRHLIPVDDQGQIPSDETNAYISLQKGHTVVWQAGSGKGLTIRFAVAQFPKNVSKRPFKNMILSPDGKYYSVNCSPGNLCDSGPINDDLSADLNHPLTCLKYPYDQIIADQKKDGWIIIDK